jgi:hypothetical protein
MVPITVKYFRHQDPKTQKRILTKGLTLRLALSSFFLTTCCKESKVSGASGQVSGFSDPPF